MTGTLTIVREKQISAEWHHKGNPETRMCFTDCNQKTQLKLMARYIRRKSLKDGGRLTEGGRTPKGRFFASSSFAIPSEHQKRFISHGTAGFSSHFLGGHLLPFPIARR